MQITHYVRQEGLDVTATNGVSYDISLAAIHDEGGVTVVRNWIVSCCEIFKKNISCTGSLKWINKNVGQEARCSDMSG